MRVNTQEGGTQAFRVGSLKRRLKTIPLLNFNPVGATTINSGQVYRLLLTGLNGTLNIAIMVGIEGTNGSVIRPASVPAGGGTVQLTPINLFPDAAGKVYGREIFQDPTATDNQDHALAQDIPFGWEGSTEADQVEIAVTVNTIDAVEHLIWGSSSITGRLVCQVTVEYNGQWWDEQAIQYAISQVTLQGEPSGNDLVNTLTIG